jgi:hypothetical protein
MATITVNLVTPAGTVWNNTELPSDVSAKEIITDTIDQLGLPAIDENNQAVVYYLETAEGKRVNDGETLMSAGVEDGGTILLKTASKIKEVGPGPDLPPPPAEGMIDLNIRLMDTNQNAFEIFSYDTKVQDVLSQIITKHKLPTRDEKFKQGKIYEIWSKTSGAFLQETLTLRELAIPNRDTLVISTHETPG